MDCPFCGKEMKEGTIPNGVKWVENGIEDWESVRLCSGWSVQLPKSFFCPDCRQIILPVPEKQEGMLEKVERTLSDVGDKIQTAQERWEARRDQEKKQKQKKEFGSKDPWEL